MGRGVEENRALQHGILLMDFPFGALLVVGSWCLARLSSPNGARVFVLPLFPLAELHWLMEFKKAGGLLIPQRAALFSTHSNSAETKVSVHL